MPVILNKTEGQVKDIQKRLEPFTVRESAIAALRGMIDAKNAIKREGMYCLEIIYQLIQNGTPIFERIPQEVFSGCPEGGRRHVEASALCRANDRTEPPKQDGILESGYTKLQEIVGRWAERDGCWSDNTDTDLTEAGYAHDPNVDGSEARVFFDEKTGYVHKAIDFSHYMSMSAFLDRITIHNAIFPETRMEITGFGLRDDATDNTGYVAVVRQPFVRGKAPDTPEEMDLVRKKLRDKGFLMPERFAGWCFVSESGNLFLGDIHDNNCVLSPEGNLLVFDCEALLNIIPSLGGKYVIPPLDYYDTAVEEIQKVIAGLMPVSIPVDVFLADGRFIGESLSCSRRNALKTQLKSFGYINGLMNGRYVVQADPEIQGNVLVSDKESIRFMLTQHNGKLDNGVTLTPGQKEGMILGKNIQAESSTYRFDLDKGRPVNVKSELKLRLEVKEDQEAKTEMEKTGKKSVKLTYSPR